MMLLCYYCVVELIGVECIPINWNWNHPFPY